MIRMYQPLARLFVGVLLALVPAISCAESEIERIPDCCVACTYGILKLQGSLESLDNVRSRFSALYPDADRRAISLAQIRGVVESYGYHAAGVRLDPDAGYRVPTPAILFLRPDKVGNENIGHVILLQSVTDEGATFSDFTAGIGGRTVTRSELATFWDGEALVVSRAALDLPSRSLPVSLLAWSILTAAVICLLCWLASRRARLGATVQSLLALFALLTVSVAGCSRSNRASSAAQPQGAQGEDGATSAHLEAATPAVLSFTEPSADIGVYRCTRLNEQIDHAFVFTVASSTPARITKLFTSCGCMTANRDLVGRNLAPGSRHQILFRLSALDRVGPLTVRAEVVTDPASSRPVVLSLSAFLIQAPIASPNPLNLAYARGSGPADIRVSLSQLRDAASAPLKLDASESDLGPFRYVEATTDRARVAVGPGLDPTFLDETQLTLALKEPLPVGRHTFHIRLAWSGDTEDETCTELPVFVHVRQPVRLQVEDLFLGVVAAGELCEHDVRLTRDPSVKCRITVVSSDNPNIVVRMDDAEERVLIRARFPDTPGRFTGRITMQFDDETMPPLTLSVSGVTQDKDS